MALVPVSGIPSKPDWDKLGELRQRQRLEYLEKKGDSIPGPERLRILDNSSPLNSFIDFLDGFGVKPFQDGIDESEAIGPNLAGPDFAMDRLHQDASFLSLHPRVRRAILMSDSVKCLSSRFATNKRKDRQDVTLRRMKTKTERSDRVKELAQTVADLGMEEASKRFVPSRVKKGVLKGPSSGASKAPPAAPRKKLPRNPQVRPSGGLRRTRDIGLAADVKALREQMEQQSAFLQQRHKDALLEKGVVDQALTANGSMQTNGNPDLYVERQSLKNTATDLTLRCMQLQKLQQGVQEQQMEMEHSKRLGEKAIAKIRRALDTVMARAASQARATEAEEGRKDQEERRKQKDQEEKNQEEDQDASRRGKDQEERRKQKREEEAQRGDQDAMGVFMEAADEDGPGGEDVQEVTGGARGGARRVYIRRTDLESHGYTPGCSGCEARLRGENSSGHSAACRAIIERAMGDTASGQRRIQNAKTMVGIERELRTLRIEGEMAPEVEAAPRASAPEVEAASSKDSPD